MNLVGLSREVADRYRDTLSQLTFNNKIVINTLTDIAKEDVAHGEIICRVIEERLKKVKPDGMLPIMYLIDSICKNIGPPYVELFQQNLVSNFSYVFQHVNEKVIIHYKSWYKDKSKIQSLKVHFISLFLCHYCSKSDISCIYTRIYFQRSSDSKIKPVQVRASLHKLRMTWGERYHVFTDLKLHQLDQKVHTIDPAWPVIQLKNRSSAPAASKPNKIHVNPAFVGKVRSSIIDIIEIIEVLL